MNISKQTGTSVVEFALLVPLLLLLVLMVSEFGIMFYRLNAVTKSVQVATIYLSGVSVHNPITATDTTIAANLAVYGNPVAGTAILPGYAPENIVITNLGQEVRVEASYDSFLILGGSLNAIMQMVTDGNTKTDFGTLKAGSVMRFKQ
jgi:Flp pilus assembly protein TadG